MLKTEVVTCPDCFKIPELCVCTSIQKLKTKHHVLILQHPQEPDEDLGTARLAHLSLPNSTLKTGLSWPNLQKALGQEAVNARWAVLYLGSGIKPVETSPKPKSSLVFVDKKGAPLHDSPKSNDIDGIVVLDGTWSQAKAIWWRNAWLLKLKRAVLVPSKPSLYKELRREPRRECLSTLETVAESLQALGEPAAVSDTLRDTFQALLNKRREQIKQKKSKKPAAEA